MTKKRTPIHPGTLLLEDFMRPLSLSQNQLAKALGVPVTRIGEIVNGRRTITAETAMRLARYFDTSVEFWMNLQARYDREVAEDLFAARIRKEVKPRESVSA